MDETTKTLSIETPRETCIECGDEHYADGLCWAHWQQIEIPAFFEMVERHNAFMAEWEESRRAWREEQRQERWEQRNPGGIF